MRSPAFEREVRLALAGAFGTDDVALGRPVGPLTTEAALFAYMRTTFGVVIPRVAICPGHVAPWTAFCDAYFARSPVAIWKASRGFGGKSFTLSLLTLVEALTLRADATVLGGSGEQSQRVLEAMAKLWASPAAPRGLLASDPAQRYTRFAAGNSIRALMASQASVRGPHPQRLRLDEIDEMDLAILDSAMGQPMSSAGVLSQVVMSSTHQYPDGTMTTVLKRAKDAGWPVYQWCFRETMQPHGWLTEAEIARKRSQVTVTMWNTEFDLQEPSAEGRAIMTEAVEAMFQTALGDVPGELGRYYEFEPPVAGARYATGADWARKVDYTEIGTLRIDVQPYRLVAYERLQRIPWPSMIERFDVRLTRYRGAACHDGTGLGDVIKSLIRQEATAVLMVGRDRQDLLSEYVKAVEQGAIVAPLIASMQSEHKYATYDDVYGSGHLPDTIAMMALAYRAAGGRGSSGYYDFIRQQTAAAGVPAAPMPAPEMPKHYACRLRGQVKAERDSAGALRCLRCGEVIG